MNSTTHKNLMRESYTIFYMGRELSDTLLSNIHKRYEIYNRFPHTCEPIDLHLIRDNREGRQAQSIHKNRSSPRPISTRSINC